MENIAFNYLYRDGANYKNLGQVIFENPTNIKIEDVLILLKTKLICKEYFYASQWQLPDLHFGTWDDEFDHTFHEFECITYTHEAPNSLITLAEFKTLVEQTITNDS